jgi:hypothetical protein
MFTLTYTLHEHGSATVAVGDGETVITFAATFLSDALGDLARGARAILRGLPEVVVRLQDEPDEHQLRLVRVDNAVELTLLRFAETFSRRADGEPLLHTRCDLRTFATVCINCLRSVRDAHGLEGYRERWRNHDFPQEAYDDLLSLRRAMNDR